MRSCKIFLILPANVTSRLTQIVNNAVTVRGDDVDDSVCDDANDDADNHDDNDVHDNDDTNRDDIDCNNQRENVDDADDKACDDRVDDVADKVDTNVITDDLSNDVNENDVNVSSQQLLKEQKDDLSLKGCFKNAESDRAGFTFVDGLVY